MRTIYVVLHTEGDYEMAETFVRAAYIIESEAYYSVHTRTKSGNKSNALGAHSDWCCRVVATKLHEVRSEVKPDRLAALLDGIREEVRQAVEEGDAQDCSSSECIADAVYEIVRVRLRGVTLLDEERLARALRAVFPGGYLGDGRSSAAAIARAYREDSECPIPDCTTDGNCMACREDSDG